MSSESTRTNTHSNTHILTYTHIHTFLDYCISLIMKIIIIMSNNRKVCIF